MSVAYYSRTPKVSREQVEKVYGYFGEHLGDSIPDGSLFHADGPLDDGGWWSFEVFASDDQFTRFKDGVMQPAFRHAGINGVEYERLDVSWDSSQG